MGKPHLWTELLPGEITDTTEVYTQRKSDISSPGNYRILLGSILTWVRNHLPKLKIQTDAPASPNDVYEYTIGGVVKYFGERGMETYLDGNQVMIRPKFPESPIDGQAWVYDEASGGMKLGDKAGDQHLRIEITTATTVWVLPHNFGWRPNYEIYDSDGNMLHGVRTTVDVNTESVAFSVARAGYACLT